MMLSLHPCASSIETAAWEDQFSILPIPIPILGSQTLMGNPHRSPWGATDGPLARGVFQRMLQSGQSTEMTESWLPGAFCSADEPVSGCCTDGTSSKLTPASAAVPCWHCGCTEVSVLEGLWVRMQVGFPGQRVRAREKAAPSPLRSSTR